jgi:hypothetical protein
MLTYMMRFQILTMDGVVNSKSDFNLNNYVLLGYDSM